MLCWAKFFSPALTQSDSGQLHLVVSILGISMYNFFIHVSKSPRFLLNRKIFVFKQKKSIICIKYKNKKVSVCVCEFGFYRINLQNYYYNNIEISITNLMHISISSAFNRNAH